MSQRDFDAWLGKFKKIISNYSYYTDFNKVYRNVNTIKVELSIMNSLIGSTNIYDDFIKLYRKYPEILKCVPILLAKRESEIQVHDIANGDVNFNFDNPNTSAQMYADFMLHTGLFGLMSNKHISSLVDYVTGVEVGLDSNARKNRGGDLMEDIVEAYIIGAGLVKNITYFKEMTISEIQKHWGVDLSCISNEGKAEKRFDFVIKRPNMIYGIETNFYASSGSKLNETARSYKTLALETKDLKNFKFVWFTDGQGWNSAKNNLQETFEVLDNLYCISDLENNVISNILK